MRDSDDKITIANVTKVYPNNIKVVQYNRAYRIKKKLPGDVSVRRKTDDEEKDNNNEDRSHRRTKSNILDIALCNSFSLWVTLTFNCSTCPGDCANSPCICDSATCHRFDFDICKSKMAKWLKAQRRKHSDMKYLIVAELHKSGAVHFHALFANYTGELVPTEKLDRSGKGRIVYNLGEYEHGFTEAISIANPNVDYPTIAGYLTKYITKSSIARFGNKHYWVSHHLNRPFNIVNGHLHGYHHKPEALRFEGDFYEVYSYEISQDIYNTLRIMYSNEANLNQEATNGTKSS